MADITITDTTVPVPAKRTYKVEMYYFGYPDNGQRTTFRKFLIAFEEEFGSRDAISDTRTIEGVSGCHTTKFTITVLAENASRLLAFISKHAEENDLKLEEK